jgi:dolichol-phosphate mannosyltransferase
MADKLLNLSAVIPFYNEEESAESVCSEVCGVLSRFNELGWELITVDDGSSDRTGRILDELSARYRNLRALHLKTNSGQSASLHAGFRAAKGELIVTLDGDGQNDPADIPLLVEELIKRGLHMICGVRIKRADNIVRRISSWISNRARSCVLKDGITDIGCALRVFRRECLEEVHFFRNAHRFFPALFKMAGFSVGEIPVNHRARKYGKSKYGGGINSRLWVGIVDLAGLYWLRKRAFTFTTTDKYGE